MLTNQIPVTLRLRAYTHAFPLVLLMGVLMLPALSSAITDELGGVNSGPGTAHDMLEATPADQWIVQLKGEPLGKVRLADHSVRARVAAVLSEGQSQIRASGVRAQIKREYRYTFLGFAVDRLSSEDAQKLKALPQVAAVTRAAVFNIMQSTATRDAAHLAEFVSTEQFQYACRAGNSGGAPCPTGRGIRIGVLDTGIDYTHPDLGGCFGPTCRVIGGYDFVNDDADPIDDHGHGTHVAAIAAANGTLLGVAPEARIVAYKVLSAAGSGGEAGILAALERAADPNGDGDTSDRLDVINMSLGEPSGNPNSPVSLAANALSNIGTVVVVSAGNSGPAVMTVGSPGAATEVLTVGATCKPEDIGRFSYCQEVVAGFSSAGPSVHGEMKPEFLAPGANICAALSSQHVPGLESLRCHDDMHIALSGTSMSTPMVAGAVALVLETHPGLSSRRVKQLLQQTARVEPRMPPLRQGRGSVDLRGALSAAIAPAVTVILDSHLSMNTAPRALTFSAEVAAGEFTRVRRAELLDYMLVPQRWSEIARYPATMNAKSITLPVTAPGRAKFASLFRVEVVSALGTVRAYRDVTLFGIPPDIAETWPRFVNVVDISGVYSTTVGMLRSADSADIVLNEFNQELGTVFNFKKPGSTNFVRPFPALQFPHPLIGNFRSNTLVELLHKGSLYTPYDQQLVLNRTLSAAPTQQLAVDVNGDGVRELILASATELKAESIDSGAAVVLPFTSWDDGNGRMRIAAGDLDGDGFPEIVSYPGIVSFTGVGFETKPYTYSAEVPTLTSFTIADINNNGQLEIAAQTYEGRFVIVENQRVRAQSARVFRELESGSAEIVVADIRDNAGLELIVGTPTRILIFDADLNLLAERSTFEARAFSYSGVTVLDVNQDGRAEIIRFLDHVYVYDTDLRLIDKSISLFPVLARGLDVLSRPQLADMDRDGMLDLVMNTTGLTLSGTGRAAIAAWHLPILAPGPDQKAFAWLNSGYDPSQTRCFRCTEAQAACSDGLDNDGDGAVDYPIDTGCRTPFDRSESNCGDGVCEDGNGREDAVSCALDCRPPAVEICTATDLESVRADLSGHYRLSCDIDLGSTDFAPIGDCNAPFVGSFDGAGHRISGLRIVRPNVPCVGLFGRITGSVENLSIENAQVTGGQQVGALAGIAEGSIRNITVNSTAVLGDNRVGGVVGKLDRATLEQAHFEGTIASPRSFTGDTFGGIVGEAQYSAIARVAAEVALSSPIGNSLGGVVGTMFGTTVQQASARGQIIVSGNSSGGGVGGLVGSIAFGGSSISESYSQVAISARSGISRIGGLLGGYISPEGVVTINDSYASGSILPSNVATAGGLVGFGQGTPVVTSSYFDRETTGYTQSAGGEGRTTSQMEDPATYVGWDFQEIWEFRDAEPNYPELRSEH